jgi:hypothetical protein
MKRLCLLALTGLASSQSFAIGHLADVSIVDRDNGETLTAHYYRGEYWVAGRPGARYAIQIRSQQGIRLLAVTSVDGINVLSGDTAAFSQRGYVFDPWTNYGIAGWRKSDSQIAAFTFTSIPRSYAARTGRPDNVGVIGVALFRERPRPVEKQSLNDAVTEAPAERFAEADSKAAADASGAGSLSSNEARRERAAPAPSLGTGHGQREESWVTNVEFVREQSQPNEIIRIRYDSTANLLAMGVIRPQAPQRPHPRPFPDEPQLSYVPDP